MKRWPQRDVAGRDPVDREAHDLGLLGLRPEGADDRLQRAHPAQAPRLAGGRAPAHGFRPGKASDDGRQDLGEHLRRRAPGPLDERHVELALLRVALDLRPRSSEASPALFRKPCTAASGAPTRGPFRSSRTSSPFTGSPAMWSASRRGVAIGLRALIEKAALDERVGDERLAGPPPHAAACGRGFPRRRVRGGDRASWGVAAHSPPPCGEG